MEFRDPTWHVPSPKLKANPPCTSVKKEPFVVLANFLHFPWILRNFGVERLPVMQVLWQEFREIIL